MRIRRKGRFLVMLVGLGVALGTMGGVTYGAFFSTASNSGNSFTSAADWTPPSASASVIAKQTGYFSGNIKQAGSYFAYANVTDTGNPASGVNTVSADLSNITTGATSVALTTTGGPWSVQGTSYSYRSSVQTASNPLSAGSKTYTLALTDVAGNNQTQTGFSVTVDNTAPTGSNIQTANGGATVGKAEAGDTITFTFSEQIDPESILSGWTGSGTSVTVRLNDKQAGCASSSDGVTIFNSGNTSQLPLGSVCLANSGYVTTNRTFTSSTMVQSGSTITVTLGTASGATGTVAATGTMSWTPVATPYDAAGNACSTAVTSEGGGADVEF